MASLTLKNLPDDLLRDLRAAAEEERRSLTQEVIHLLERALHARAQTAAEVPADARAQVAAWRKLAGRWESDMDQESEATRIRERRTPGRKVEL